MTKPQLDRHFWFSIQGHRAAPAADPEAVDPGTRELSTIRKTTIGAIRGGSPIQTGRPQLRPGRRAAPADRPDPGRKIECDKTPAQGMFLDVRPGDIELLPGKSSGRRPGTSSSTRVGGCSPESRRQPSGLSGPTWDEAAGSPVFSMSTRSRELLHPPPETQKPPARRRVTGEGFSGRAISFVGQSEARHLGWHSHDRSVRTGWRYPRPTISGVRDPI